MRATKVTTGHAGSAPSGSWSHPTTTTPTTATHARDAGRRAVRARLRNLVGNALQHGAPPVDVVIEGPSDEVSVTVANDGAGVPPELASTVFDRFVRADTARSGWARAGASTGLGLSIAAENARLHGATLDVSTSGRSALTLRLPRRPADVTD